MKNKIIVLGLTLFALSSLNADVINFEDVDLGSNKYMQPAVEEQNSTNDWSSADIAYFSYDHTWWGSYSSWTGFKVSKDTDITTKGYTNQYSSITGKGAAGSSQYAILYADSSNMTVDGSNATTDMSLISFGDEIQISSIAISNTTYSYYSMAEGDGFTPSILGSEYYMNLIIYGVDVNGDISGMITHVLGNGTKISNTWETVDLSVLGAVVGIGFAFETNNTSDYTQYGSGICANYPSYIAFDNITYNVPEPSTYALIFGGLALCFAIYRHRKSA